jgi:hypothetical protein
MNVVDKQLPSTLAFFFTRNSASLLVSHIKMLTWYSRGLQIDDANHPTLESEIRHEHHPTSVCCMCIFHSTSLPSDITAIAFPRV